MTWKNDIWGFDLPKKSHSHMITCKRVPSFFWQTNQPTNLHFSSSHTLVPNFQSVMKTTAVQIIWTTKFISSDKYLMMFTGFTYMRAAFVTPASELVSLFEAFLINQAGFVCLMTGYRFYMY